MAKVVSIDGVKMFKHEFKEKIVYAGRLSYENLDAVLNELYLTYNKVEFKEFGNWLAGYKLYYEITCIA